MIGQVVDWVFEEMVMKVVDLDFEIDKVEMVEEDNILVEKKDMVVAIEDIEDIFHNYFSKHVPKMDFEIVGAKVAMALGVVQLFCGCAYD